MSEELRLRPYQQGSVDETRVAMALYKHIALVLQQGGGKSFILAFMVKNAVNRGKRVFVISHRREIISQNSNIIKDLGIDVQIIDPKAKRIKDVNCHVAMAQTMKRRCQNNDDYKKLLYNADLVLIDEMHLSHCDFIFDYISTNTFVVGLTGTPERRGTQKQLGLMYDCIVTTISPSDLIDLRYIIPADVFFFEAPKIKDVAVDSKTGDWNQKQLSKLFTKPERYGGIVSNWKRICPNEKTIVFTSSAQHCIDLTKEFRKNGISAKYLLSDVYPETDSELSGDREQIKEDFSSGTIQVLVNLDILTVGYNEPSIGCVVLDINTLSYTKYSQAAGRGCRPFPDMERYFLLDFGGNAERHGRPEDNRNFSLWHNTGQGGGVPMTKECPKEKGGCNRLIHIGYSDCPFCNYHFPTQGEIYDVELRRMVGDAQDVGLMTLEQYVAAMKLKGWRNDNILRSICVKNPENQKKAFMDAIKVLRTNNGEKISEAYWYSFKKYKLKGKKR